MWTSLISFSYFLIPEMHCSDVPTTDLFSWYQNTIKSFLVILTLILNLIFNCTLNTNNFFSEAYYSHIYNRNNLKKTYFVNYFMSNNTCLTHFEMFKTELTRHLSNFQLVTLVTYIYFIFTVIGRQKIHGYGPGNGPIHEFMRSGRIPLEMDLYFPLFTILQLFFYMGLLKVRISN